MVLFFRGAAAALYVPDPYMFQVIIMSLIFAIAVLAMNLIIGFTGQASLAHAAFFGFGAYGVAIMTKAGISFWLALPAAALHIGPDRAGHRAAGPAHPGLLFRHRHAGFRCHCMDRGRQLGPGDRRAQWHLRHSPSQPDSHPIRRRNRIFRQTLSITWCWHFCC
jgi:hypothetical protein